MEIPVFLARKQLAAMLNISTRTLDNYREQGILPEPILKGKSLRWRLDEVLEALTNKGE